jgi:tetratricopeptide (TPR) repeat protein
MNQQDRFNPDCRGEDEFLPPRFDEVEYIDDARPPWGLIIGIFGGLMLAGVLFAAGLTVYQRKHRPMAPLPPRPVETREERMARSAEAFTGTDIDLEDPRAAEIHALVEDLRTAFVDRDRERLRELYDLERMFQETVRAGGIRVTQEAYRQMEAGFTSSVEKNLPEQGRYLGYERFEIKRIEFSEDHGEAVVYLRGWTEDGILMKSRWWIAKSGGAWKVYDFEDLTTCLRASDAGAAMLSMAMHDLPTAARVRAHMERLNAAIMAMVDGDMETARHSLGEISPSDLPGPMRAMWHFLSGSLAIGDGEWETALRHCDEAERLHPDLVGLHLLRAGIYNAQERHAEALREAETYLSILGGDADATFEQATALEGLGRDDEAMAAIRAGLDDDPGSVTLLLELLTRLPEDGLAEIGERLRASHDPELAFDTLCWEVSGDAPRLRALIDSYEQFRPGDINIAFYSAQLHLLEDRPEDALAALQPVMDAARDRDDWDYFQQLWLQAAAAGDNWRTVYESSEEPQELFPALAQSLQASGNVEGLRELVRIRQEQGPDDGVLQSWLGQIAELDEDWRGAEEAYRRAVQLEKDDDARQLHQFSVARMMYHTGRASEAVHTIGPRDEVFHQLMMMAEFDLPESRSVMTSLLDEAVELKTNETVVSWWRAKLAAANGDYEEAVAEIEEQGEMLASHPAISWELPSFKISLLVRLERYDAAEKLAHELAAEYEPIYLAVVAAARGDVDETEKVLLRCIDAGYEPWQFYADKILGEKLRTLPFARLMERFPPTEEALLE